MVLQQIIKPLLLLPILGIFLVGCDGNSGYDYDDGYESAWEEGSAPTRFSSQKYRDGYEQGLQDAVLLR